MLKNFRYVCVASLKSIYSVEYWSDFEGKFGSRFVMNDSLQPKNRNTLKQTKQDQVRPVSSFVMLMVHINGRNPNFKSQSHIASHVWCCLEHDGSCASLYKSGEQCMWNMTSFNTECFTQLMWHKSFRYEVKDIELSNRNIV